MENNAYLLAHIFSHHPATYPYVRMLHKSYVRESADLLLQTVGQYPISYNEFTQFCCGDGDFVCFVLDNSLNPFRIYHCCGKYCHIKETKGTHPRFKCIFIMIIKN
jgi:hypothetical protein